MISLSRIIFFFVSMVENGNSELKELGSDLPGIRPLKLIFLVQISGEESCIDGYGCLHQITAIFICNLLLKQPASCLL